MTRNVLNSTKATQIVKGDEIRWLAEVVRILNNEDEKNVMRQILIYLLDQPLNELQPNGEGRIEATMTEIANDIGVYPSQVSQNITAASRRLVPLFKTRKAHPIVYVSINPRYREMLLNFRASRLEPVPV